MRLTSLYAPTASSPVRTSAIWVYAPTDGKQAPADDQAVATWAGQGARAYLVDPVADDGDPESRSDHYWFNLRGALSSATGTGGAELPKEFQFSVEPLGVVLTDPALAASVSGLDPADRALVGKRVRRGVLPAAGALDPSAPLARAILAKAVALLKGVPQYAPERPSYRDVDHRHPAYVFVESLRGQWDLAGQPDLPPGVRVAHLMGGATRYPRTGTTRPVLAGTGDRFHPDAPVSRLDLAVLAARLAGLEGRAAQLAAQARGTAARRHVELVQDTPCVTLRARVMAEGMTDAELGYVALAFEQRWLQPLRTVEAVRPSFEEWLRYCVFRVGAKPQWVAELYLGPERAVGILEALRLVDRVSWRRPEACPAEPRVTSPALPPVQGRNMVWRRRFPDVVGTDLEFQRRGDRVYAFVASMGTGFRVFDVTNPEDPVPVGVYPSPGYQNDVQVQGNLAVLATDLPNDPGGPRRPTCPDCGVFEGIELVDVSNPALPTKLADLWIDGGAHNATLVGNRVYVSNPSRRALDIVDVSNPRQPRVVLRITEEGRCQASPYPCRVLQAGEQDFMPHDITAVRWPDKGLRRYVAAVEATFILAVEGRRGAGGGEDPQRRRVPLRWHRDRPPGRSQPGRAAAGDLRRAGRRRHPRGLPRRRTVRVRHPRRDPAPQAGDLLRPLHGRRQLHGAQLPLPPRPAGDRRSLVFGGSRVIDLSGPAPARELDLSRTRPGLKTTWGRTLGYVVMPGADTWAAKTPGVTPDGRLFVFADDMVRGMDVFEYVGALPPPAAR